MIELLVSMAVLSVLVVLAASLIGAIQNVSRLSSARTEQFRSSRQALETVTARLSQATLNPYWSLDSATNPTRYERQSELRFFAGPAISTIGSPLGNGTIARGSAIFFQAPTGYFSSNSTSSNSTDSNLNASLNTWGYFVEYGPDSDRPPFISSSIIPTRNRFRLMEFIEPSDNLSVFSKTSGNSTYTGKDWFTSPLGTAGNRRVLAENIVAFVALPRLSSAEDATGTALSSNYTYDSTASNSTPRLNPKHQLPPIVDIAVVAISETTANRITWGSTPPVFVTSTLFQNAANMDADLETLRSNIEAMNLSARVFRTSVPISAARWSTEQQN